MTHTMTKTLMLTAAAILLLAAPAMAGDNGHGRGHSKGRGDDGVHVSHAYKSHTKAVIADTDRGRIRSFMDDHYRKNCPPGLAKKHNGCLPPGQAKKHYVGEVITIEKPQSLWHQLADMISPPPSGHRYIRMDNEVLLIDSANRVVDIVSTN